MNREDWKDIQNKIDTQYEKKLKQVSDDAMNKLQAFQHEHKQLLEKTQYLLDNSQVKGGEDSFVEDYEIERQSIQTLQPKQDRNRFFSPIVKDKMYEPLALVEKKVDPQAIRQLHQEYQDVLFTGKNLAGEIYLVDVLKEFHFLFEDKRQVMKNNELFAFLDQSKQNLLIASDLESFKNEQDDVSRNLFKIICAIVNQNVNQRGHNFLDDKILYTYLDSINYNRDDPDLIYAEQVAAIKSLINRKTYSLTD